MDRICALPIFLLLVSMPTQIGAMGAVNSGPATPIPQVVAPGCLVYYVAGPLDTLTREQKKRKYFVHSSALTLVRATPKEMEHIGRVVAKKINMAMGPVRVFIPLKGFCDPDRRGAQLYDPEGNNAFINSMKRHINKDVPIAELDFHINDEQFIDIMIKGFLEIMNIDSN